MVSQTKTLIVTFKHLHSQPIMRQAIKRKRERLLFEVMVRRTLYQHLLIQKVLLTLVILKRFEELFSRTETNGNTTYYTYNYKGQLTRVTDALGNVTTYIYGGTGGCPSCGSSGGDNLISIVDANGNITTYEYDTLGRLTKETDPIGNSITYSYDSKGNLTLRTDANGNTITYTYDAL